MPESCTQLIDQLVELRKEKSWTQQDLAKACGMTQSVIARIERRRSLPTLMTLQRIAEALGATLSLVKQEAS